MDELIWFVLLALLLGVGAAAIAAKIRGPP